MKILFVFTSLSMSLFALTLSESIELAVANSPKVSISKSSVSYSKYMKNEAVSSYHPTLDAAFAWQKLDNETAFSYSPTHNYSLSLKYNLFNGFSDSSNINSKEYELEASKLNSLSVIADLKLSVIKAYTDYLKVQKAIKTQEEQLTSLTKQYDDTDVKYEQGIVAKNELLMIDVQKLKVEQALIKVKSDFIVARHNLENIMATAIAENEEISDFNIEIQEVEDILSLESQMMENRSEIKAMLLNIKSLNSQKDAVDGNYLPKVNIEVKHQINDKERKFGTVITQPKDQTTYGVNASWNLYGGFSDTYKKKAILEKRNQQNYQLNQLKLDLKKQLRKAYEDFKVAKSAKYVAYRTKESAEENYRITSDRYSYGKVDTLTLLVSQSNLTEAENANNNAYYDLYMAYKTLQRVVSQ